jgi:hypothetical protein
VTVFGYILLALAAGFLVASFREGGRAVLSVIAAVLGGLAILSLGWPHWAAWVLFAAAVVGILFLLFGVLWITRVAVAVAIAVVLVGGSLHNIDLSDENDNVASGNKTTTTVHRQSTTTSTEPRVRADDVANQVTDIFTGYKDNELAMGTKNVKFEGAPEERGTAAFSKRTLKTPEQVGDFLNEDSDVSVAANDRVVSAIKSAGYGDDEVARALNGDGYFPVQTKVASQVLGTTYYKDGKVLEAGEWRQVRENDVFWLFMTKDGKIIKGASVRADCGNPNLKQVRPVRPNTPPAPPVEQSPCVEKCKPTPTTSTTQPKSTTTTTRPTTSTTLTPKDPRQNIDRNPSVPPQDTKTQPSPDNQQVVSQPATQPTDSPTGCNGSCPAPSTTTTTRPAGSSSTTATTTPSCGQAGQPSCYGTGSPSPTTTAPAPQGDPNPGYNSGTVPGP